MKKIPVKIDGLSYSQSQVGAYVLVLSEMRGSRKIPVIIRPNEAQYIAIKMESAKSKAPLTYDLFRSAIDSLGGSVTEVLIENIVEGMFYCRLAMRSESGEKIYVPSAVGDAMSVSLAYGCPVYVTRDVMELAGIDMGGDGEDQDEEGPGQGDGALGTLSLDGLERMLADAIESEEYELASQLRDRIAALKEKQGLE